jgi:hypothetical protein
MVQEFSQWLSETPVSLAIQNAGWVIPAAQSVHILAISVVLATMAMLDLRMLGLAGRHHPVSSMAARFIPAVWIALCVLAATGLVLIVGEPARELLNPAFRWKMALVAGAIAVTWLVQSTLRSDGGFWDMSPGRKAAARVLAITSLSLWITIAVLGRWIAYVEAPL